MAKKKSKETRVPLGQQLVEAKGRIAQLEKKVSQLSQVSERVRREKDEATNLWCAAKRTVQEQGKEILELKQNLVNCEEWRSAHSKRVHELEPIVNICRPLLYEAGKVANSFARVLAVVHAQTKPSDI